MSTRVGDGQVPPLHRPPRDRAELARLIDYLAEPGHMEQWLELLAMRDDSQVRVHQGWQLVRRRPEHSG